jgi:hypothetical protein
MISVGALTMAWLPHILWPSRGTPNTFAIILSVPGIVALLPGVLITTYIRGFAALVIHHADFARAMASGDANGVAYVVFNDIGFSLSYSFICSLLVTWSFYFLIAWQIFKSNARRISSRAALTSDN